MELEQTIFQLVLHGGNARGEAYEALDAAEEGDFATAEKHLQQAEEEFLSGHKWQTELIQTTGDEVPSFLSIHAQDHLMTALAEMNLIKRIIHSYRVIEQLEKRIEKLEAKATSDN